MIDQDTSIPIQVDEVLIAIVNKDGTINPGHLAGDKLYEIVARFNDLAKIDPAVFMLLSAVVAQSALIQKLQADVDDLRKRLEPKA